MPGQPRDSYDTVLRKLSELERELEREKRHKHPTGQFGFADEQVFNLAGLLYVSESARWYPPVLINVIAYVASLDTAGSSTTTVIVTKNGSTVKTITLSAAETYEAGDSVFAVDTGDYVQTAITAAGTGAAGIDVQLRYRRSVG